MPHDDVHGQVNHEVMHQLKNLLSINLGFCDLLLDELEPADRRHADVLQIRNATVKALQLLPLVSVTE
jgi:hypothetical protein